MDISVSPYTIAAILAATSGDSGSSRDAQVEAGLEAS